jgi:hypothetical protein
MDVPAYKIESENGMGLIGRYIANGTNSEPNLSGLQFNQLKFMHIEH